MENIFFTQDRDLNFSVNFFEYIKNVEKDYDQDKIIEWVETHKDLLSDRKVWLLTGHAYDKTYSEWEKWVLDNGYEIVVDCRGFGQVLLGDVDFQYKNIKQRLEQRGVKVFSLSRD